MEFNITNKEFGIERLQELISPVTSDKLHVALPDEYKGKYELPKPATKYMPDWYKQTELKYDDDNPLNKSVRACMPFMEALTFGWIIPVPTDVSIVRKPNGIEVEWNDQSFKCMGSHEKGQIGGDNFPHNGEVIKFNLPYILRTPKGVSTLYMPPLNRVETRFRVFSGIVDTDEYVNEINIPALITDSDWEGVIEAGTPLAQVIPFQRDSVINESETRTMTDKEEELRERTSENVPAVDAYYKEEVWEPIPSSKETGSCPMGFGEKE